MAIKNREGMLEILKMAENEEGRKGLVDNYLSKHLEQSGVKTEKPEKKRK